MQPSQEISGSDGDDGLSRLDGFLDLMAEMQIDEAFGNEAEDDVKPSSASKTKHAEPVDVVEPHLVVKQPLTESISRSGNSIYCGSLKTGTISYLTHWSPAAMAGNCLVHGNCYCTVPLLGGDEDSLIRWIGEAKCYNSAADHMACVPADAYFRRVRRAS